MLSKHIVNDNQLLNLSFTTLLSCFSMCNQTMPVASTPVASTPVWLTFAPSTVR